MLKKFFKIMKSVIRDIHETTQTVESRVDESIKSFEPNKLIELRVAESRKEVIFSKIEVKKDISAIPDSFWLLLSNNSYLKQRVAEGLLNLVRSTSSTQLLKIDSLFRERTSFEWAYDWRNKNPTKLVEPNMSDDQKVLICGLASFHPNGYFREKAIRSLNNFETGSELPFLFIRLNDWVSEVRTLAKETVMKRLNAENSKNIINCLPIIFHLRHCKRDNHDKIVDLAVSCLSSLEGKKALMDGLTDNDCKIRSTCYEMILGMNFIDRKVLLEYLKKEPLPHIRSMVLHRIQSEITFEEFQEIRHWIFKDKSPSIRVLALEMLCKLSPLNCFDELEKSAMDNSLSVRETARFFMKKLGQYDFGQLYRSVILKSKISEGVISGLGEVGEVSDSKIIETFLNNDNVRIVKASMRAVAKLDFPNHKEKITLFLSDLRPGISKEAKILLNKELNKHDAEVVYGIYLNSQLHHVCKNCALLLTTLGKWDCLAYILEFCASCNDEINLVGNVALRKWIVMYNRSFVSPTKKQVAAIKEALSKYHSIINDNACDFIEFNLKSF